METEITKSRKSNPRENVNPISAILYLYMFPIFRRNYKNELKEDDLTEPLIEDRSKTLGDELQKVWKNENVKHPKYALHFSLLKIHWKLIILYGLLQLINELSLVALMPLSVGGFVSYFESGADANINEAYRYAGLLTMSIAVDVFINHSTAMGLMHISLKMGIACSTAIYRKSLKLSQKALAETTVGHVINLLSNDISNFDYSLLLIHYIWIAPIQAMVGTYLLYNTIGVSAFSGLCFIFIFIPLQIFLGHKRSELNWETSLRTDKRVNLMNQILNAIQVIKMYTWEEPFAKLISLSRRSEIKIIRRTFYIGAITFALEMITTGFSTFITIVVYVSLGNDVTAEIVYSIMAIFDSLRPTIIIMFSEAILSLAEVHISINRIQQFLSKEDTEHLAVDDGYILENSTYKNIDISEIKCELPNISLEGVSAQWSSESSDMDLKDIDFKINQNHLISIVGPVGSGKSSLLNVILKELPLSSGTIKINGKISYAAQDTWLFSASVRRNILFDDSFDEDRYKSVIKICGLEDDLTSFQYGDRTIVGEKGKVLSGGQKARISLARCVYKKADIYLLDDPLSAVDTKVGRQLYENCIKRFLKDKICVLITHQLQYLKSANEIVILDGGMIIGRGTYNELQNSGLDFAKLLRQFESDDQETLEEDDEICKHLAVPEDDSLDPEVLEERVESGSIKGEVYAAYFRGGGSRLVFSILIFIFILSQVVSNLDDYFISYWVNLEQEFAEKAENLTLSEDDTLNRDIIISIYTVLIIITVVLALTQSIFFFLFLMRASINIHNAMFIKILYATMRFFNLNPTGRILNRFSEDLGTIDEYIPGVLADVIEIALHFFGTIIITSIINPWLLIPASGLLIFFYLLRNIYLETSRSVKRIEGATRSPIFSHVTATLQGLSTIRAFHAQRTLTVEYDNLQNIHSSAAFLFIASGQAFAFWLDAICGICVSIIILSLLFFNKEFYGGDIGLIISQYLSLTGVLQWGMHQWSELENNMTSVERVLEYNNVDTEPDRKKISTIPKDWPEYGKIIFQSLSMKYNPDESAVLKNLTFKIHPHEKIGIVGRTGAGKSSIIAALFQLYETEGSIFIDDVNITKIPIDELRSKLSIIPQEPVLFSGTVRKNLDPFEEYNDEVLWNALEQVKLKEEISESPFGLNCSVTEGGSNFSVGQRQLVCLARALIRNNRILVMDEATANIDPQTDALIQSTIREKFHECTVLTIAHRLHTIMDSDRVLVLDSGELLEFDHPYKLLQNANGIFYGMVQTTGKTVAKNLYSIAQKNMIKLKNV